MESLGLEKKTAVSKVLAESSNFGENKTAPELIASCPGDLPPPA